MGIPVNYVFDARQYDPDMGFELLPADNYDFEVVNTEIKELGASKTKAFVLTVLSTSGATQGKKTNFVYNLWHANPDTVGIAHKQLSAIGYVTGVFVLDMANEGAALRGARFKARVTNDGTYNNIKEVFDVNGNKPNKAGTGMSQQPVAVAAPNSFQQAPVAASSPAAPAGQWQQPAGQFQQQAAPQAPQQAPAQQFQQAPQYAVPGQPGNGFVPGVPTQPAAPVQQQPQQQWNQQPAPGGNPAPWS
jgi:hypothetical protein